MDKPITTRLPEKFVKELKEIAEKENLDTSTVIRKFLAESLKEWKLKTIIDKLESQKISIGKASELLDISLWEMIDLVKEKNIRWPNPSIDDIEKEIASLK